MTPVILTRRELYDLVWSKPLRDVAADLGISDVGLAKVCARHRCYQNARKIRWLPTPVARLFLPFQPLNVPAVRKLTVLYPIRYLTN